MPRRRRPPSRPSGVYDNHDEESFIPTNRMRKETKNNVVYQNSRTVNDASSKVDWLIYMLSLCFLASALYTYSDSFAYQTNQLNQLIRSKRNFRGFSNFGNAKLSADASFLPRLPSYAQEPGQKF